MPVVTHVLQTLLYKDLTSLNFQFSILNALIGVIEEDLLKEVDDSSSILLFNF